LARKVGTSNDNDNIVVAVKKVTNGLPITGKGRQVNWEWSLSQP
jgi:hypothetical protein